MAVPTQGTTPTPTPTTPAPREAYQKDRGFLVDGISPSADSTLDLSQAKPVENTGERVQEQLIEQTTEQPAVAPESTVETEVTPEAEVEAQVEQPVAEVQPELEPEPEPAQQEPPVTPETIVPQIDPLYKKIETVLEEDLKDAYLRMDPELQQKFKEKGEETTSKIRELLSATKINTAKIFKLIRKWLKMIPGVNRFFLEQEAKIKTDKINLIAADQTEDQENTIA